MPPKPPTLGYFVWMDLQYNHSCHDRINKTVIADSASVARCGGPDNGLCKSSMIKGISWEQSHESHSNVAWREALEERDFG